jgi:cyclic pyranopterin phosphate synthase
MNDVYIACLMELQEWLPRAEILSFDEITRQVRIASALGVTKLRITGGEPLVRQNVLQLFRQLGELTKIIDIDLNQWLASRQKGRKR